MPVHDVRDDDVGIDFDLDVGIGALEIVEEGMLAGRVVAQMLGVRTAVEDKDDTQAQ